MRASLEIREPSLHNNLKQFQIKITKYWSLIAMIILAIYITLDFFFIGYTKYILISFLKWVEAHPWPGVFTFSSVYCIATILWIPGSLLTLGAGYIFGRAFGIGLGIALGTLSVFIGATSGAIFAFLIGRYIFRDIVQEWCKKYPILLAIDKSFTTIGLRLMLLLRLSPIVPFCVINYVIAGTSLSFHDYTVSLIGILPGTITYVFIGTTLSNYLGFHDDGSKNNNDNDSQKNTANYIQLISLLIGIILTILATILLSYQARKELLKYRTNMSDEDFISSPPVDELLSSPMNPINENMSGINELSTNISFSSPPSAVVSSNNYHNREDSIDSRTSSSARQSSRTSKYSLPRSQKSSSYLGGENVVDPIEEYSVYM